MYVWDIIKDKILQLGIAQKMFGHIVNEAAA